MFAALDAPLRQDIEWLLDILGVMLQEQTSTSFIKKVESIRNAAIQHRENGHDITALASQINGLECRQAQKLVRAFGMYFQGVNISERVHRIRQRRDTAMSADSIPPADSILDAITRLHAQGVTLDTLVSWLPKIAIEPVFTAHPTEAMRRVLLEKERVITEAMLTRATKQHTPDEQATHTAIVQMALTATWQTRDSSPVRPSIEDEREHVAYYIIQVLYHVVPALYEMLDRAISRVYQQSPSLPRILSFGTWVGGDMDGNPNVNAQTVEATLSAQRRTVLTRYIEELWHLARLLSQSYDFVDPEGPLLARLATYQQQYPEFASQSRPRHRDMPYRLLNDVMRARLQATLDQQAGSYLSPEELEDDIQLCLQSLEANNGKHAGWFALRRLLWRVRTFGFHLARLDVRQESRVHSEAIAYALHQANWSELSVSSRAEEIRCYANGDKNLPTGNDEGNQRLQAVFVALATAYQRYGKAALGHYIVSMTHDRVDMLSVLALARRGGLVDEDGRVPLDIVPLFETIDDLQRAEATLLDLVLDPAYRLHLEHRGNIQIVMLGYSDSGKDGGIAASRWCLQRAQKHLLECAERAGINVTFFHGRGGSVIRGGSKIVRAIDAGPRGSVGGRLRVTEQGEVIHRKYGIKESAIGSLERMTAAVFLSSISPRKPEPREPTWRKVMECISGESGTAYRGLIDAPSFMRYFRLATPIDVIERMTLGSRPSRRMRQDDALAHLRAIPWVFAWSQARAAVPGWYGMGSGIQAAVDAGYEQTLLEMSKEWPFFRMLLDDVAMVLSKADLVIAERFSRLAGDLHPYFFSMVEKEFRLTNQWVKSLMGQQALLSHDPRLAQSIHLRNPSIDPISIIQVDLLQRWRATDGSDDDLLRVLVTCVNSVSQGLQNTG